MGWEFYKTKTVKCRKPHKCALCSIEIKAGEKSIYFSGKWEGNFDSGYECLNCSELVEKLGKLKYLDPYEFSEDNYHDAAQEYLCVTCENECDMSSVSDDEYEKWTETRIEDNENCKFGAYPENCRCVHRTEKDGK